MRSNVLPLHEIASTDEVSLAMIKERYHSGPFTPCHSERSEESNSAQSKLRGESHSAGQASQTISRDYNESLRFTMTKRQY
jgi:hypothetical protein